MVCWIFGALHQCCAASWVRCHFCDLYIYCNISLMHCIFGALHLWCYLCSLLVCYALASLVLCICTFCMLCIGIFVSRWCAMHLWCIVSWSWVQYIFDVA